MTFIRIGQSLVPVITCAALSAILALPVSAQRLGGAESQLANTWIAKSSTGLTLMGTWTALPGQTSGTVTGTWTLIDTQGRTVAGGAWSASKSPAAWRGAWRAVVAGRTAEDSGTWTARVHLKATAQFADLFEKAVQTIVSGNWRYGRHSGAWSIRAYK